MTGRQQAISPDEAKAIAQDGYIFGLPPVYIGIQAEVQTNVAKPEGGGRRSSASAGG